MSAASPNAVAADNVAVITGAAGGIGLGIARAAASRGMRLVIADLDGARVSETAAGLAAAGAVVEAVVCDVRDLAQVEALRDTTLSTMGRIDLVCNNAGLGLAKSIGECNAADWQLLLDVNLMGVKHGIQTFVPILTGQGHGHINATASLSGLVGDPDLVIYNGTKFAVVGLMEALALEFHRDTPGVTVSVLCPGPVATDLIATSSKALADAGTSQNEDHDVVEYLATGMSPDQVGEVTVEGIANGDFWLLPHAELVFELMEPRFAAMKQRKLWIPPDWTQQQ